MPSQPSTIATPKFYSAKVLSYIVILISLLVLAGWFLEVEPLKRVHKDWASMKLNTALSFLLLGVAILQLLKERTNSTVFFLQAISILVMSTGLLTLTEYIFDIDLKIDYFFFKESLYAAGSIDPPRMGPNTALGFALLGVATYLAAFQKAKISKQSELFALAGWTIGFFGFLGYLYEVPSLYGVSNFTRMAVHTSIILMLTSIALLAAQPSLVTTKTFMSNSAGGITLRRWLPLIILVPLLIAKACLALYHHGLLNIELWVTFGIALITTFVAVVIFKYSKLINKFDESRFQTELELRKKQLEDRHMLSNVINEFLATFPETEQAFLKILEISCNHLGWKYAALWLVNNDSDSLVFEAAWFNDSVKNSEFERRSREQVFLSGVGLPGRVWATNEAHWIPDVTKDDNFPRAPFALQADLRGALGFPISIGGKVFGVIEVFNTNIEKTDNYLLSICKTIGNNIGAFVYKRQLERSLRNERDFIKTLFECSPSGIFSFDKNLKFTSWNKAMEKLTGVFPDGVIGKTALEVFPHILNTETQKKYVAVLKGERFCVEGQEFTYLTTGKKGFCDVNWVPLLNEKAEIIGGLAVVSDVTEKKNTENKLREQESIVVQSSKMSSLGEMAGGIAHEINSPLTVISLHASRIQECLTQDSFDSKTIQKSVSSIEKTTFRIAQIVKALRTFAKDGTTEPPRSVSVKCVVEDTLALCSERFRNHGIDLILEVDDTITLSCRAIQLSQVLLNLLNNAYDAIEGRQDKWIKLAIKESDHSVEIVVTDSGTGIPAAVREKLMQPFFTTKEIGKGTGLGLSISKGIIESHGGSLKYASHSKNTSFVIDLPKQYPHSVILGARSNV